MSQPTARGPNDPPPHPLHRKRLPSPSWGGVGARGRPLAVLAALALLPLPTLAQIIPTGSPAADILLSQAITEQRVFLTCSSLDPAAHLLVVDGWLRDVDAAIAILTEQKAPPEAIAAFKAAAAVEALLPAPGTPFEDVKQHCDANPEWQATYARFNFTLLELKLPEAFQ